MTISREALQRISARCVSRWDRFYVPSKLRTDPVYGAVLNEVRGSRLPVLDVGCGIGLLTHCLREHEHVVPMIGFDFDERKIASATQMAQGFEHVAFSVGDARSELPAHHGHVVILDILQFFEPDEQDALLRAAALRVALNGKLIIRSGLRDQTWRHRVTVIGDVLAKATRWMRSGPVSYPTSAQFERVLGECGLRLRVTPMWGGTPFNNHLIVGERDESAIKQLA